MHAWGTRHVTQHPNLPWCDYLYASAAFDTLKSHTFSISTIADISLLSLT